MVLISGLVWFLGYLCLPALEIGSDDETAKGSQNTSFADIFRSERKPKYGSSSGVESSTLVDAGSDIVELSTTQNPARFRPRTPSL
jgi:hypothetical protein